MATLLLADCANRVGTFPSLAPRTVEKISFAEPDAKPLPVAQHDPALEARIADIDRQLTIVMDGFDRDAAAATRAAAVAHNRPVGSDAWIAAQTALAQLDDWRARASSLATDVVALATNRAATLAPPYLALDSLAQRAEAEVRRQSNTIATIQAEVKSA